MTTTSPLTERYVDATLRRLPERQRGDIEKELRASIADAIDDRVEAGGDPAAAERQVLTELGDPARLAAGYADRPLHLIGPAFYLDWLRLLTALLVTVVPLVAVIMAVLRLVTGGPVGTAIGDAIGSALTTGFHIVFWTTLLFVVIERTPALRASAVRRPWTPDDLPELPTRRAQYGELIAETVFLVLFVAFILLTPVLSFQTDADGDPIGLLSPRLWDTGLVYVFIALAVAGLGVNIAKLYVHWNVPLAVGRALVTLASAAVVIWIGTHHMLINPAFAAAANWPAGVTRWVDIGLVITGVIAVIQAIVELVVGLVTRSWGRPDWGRVARDSAERVKVLHR